MRIFSKDKPKVSYIEESPEPAVKKSESARNSTVLASFGKLNEPVSYTIAIPQVIKTQNYYREEWYSSKTAEEFIRALRNIPPTRFDPDRYVLQRYSEILRSTGSYEKRAPEGFAYAPRYFSINPNGDDFHLVDEKFLHFALQQNALVGILYPSAQISSYRPYFGIVYDVAEDGSYFTMKLGNRYKSFLVSKVKNYWRLSNYSHLDHLTLFLNSHENGWELTWELKNGEIDLSDLEPSGPPRDEGEIPFPQELAQKTTEPSESRRHMDIVELSKHLEEKVLLSLTNEEGESFRIATQLLSIVETTRGSMQLFDENGMLAEGYVTDVREI